MQKDTDLIAQISEYYTAKLAEHGATPRGVDWNGVDSQVLRFEQLCKIISAAGHFTVNDLGCGYGALYDFLVQGYAEFSYAGFDVSGEMILAAENMHTGRNNVRFLQADSPDEVADYGVASGIFNVRLDRSDAEWQAYLEATLEALDKTSRRGFAFNCLTSYSDTHKMRDYLYYADPCQVFDLCKRRFSRDVALLHDYGLYEFVILVRKQA